MNHLVHPTPSPLLPAPTDSFVERAHHLVAFLADGRATPGAARRRERELAEWIVRWQNAPQQGRDRAQHFVADELGIIMRAISGPATRHSRLPDKDQERICWLIARCMAQAH